jgi:hypothetical protein
VRKSTIIILVILIAVFVAGVFYMERKQESETGYRDGSKMGFLYGFHDGKGGDPAKVETLKQRLVIEGGSTYDKAFLVGAKEGYLRGYDAGKGGE